MNDRTVKPPRGDPQRLLSARDAFRLHGIPRGTINSWHSRRQFTNLHAYGRDKHGHPLFRETDLLWLRDQNGPRDRRRGRST